MNNNIIKMITRRIGQSVIILIIVTFFVFLLMQSIPGDPIRLFLGPGATEEQIEYYTKLFGYDQPLLVQYGKWIINLFKGEMGRSVTLQRDISEVIFERLGITLSIVLPAFILAVIVGTIFGILAALNRGRLLDTVVSYIANIGIAMPLFWLGIILILTFSLKLKIFPVQGYIAPWENFGESVKRLIMPVIVCSFSPMAQFTRQTRSAMLEVIRQDYVRTAEAKGLKKGAIILKHQLRNALIPIITVMGSQLGIMVGTTIVIESVFVIPGIGSMMITAIRTKDFMVVQNVILVIGVFVVLCNLLVDVLYGIIDPRIRDQK